MSVADRWKLRGGKFNARDRVERQGAFEIADTIIVIRPGAVLTAIIEKSSDTMSA
jgi:hypothetical protein